jgi:hypothetical protein
MSIAVATHKLCGAKRRKSTETCKGLAMANGRCRLHGGKANKGVTHPGFQTGKHSKYLYLPPVLTARVEELTGDALQNLEESIKIQRSIETQLLEKLGTGESPDAWNALGKIIDADDEEMPPAAKLAAIRSVVDGALGELSLQQRIQSIHDTQRKLTETLSKVRKEAQETFTLEQWNAMLHTVMLAARKAITDPKTLTAFVTELDAHRAPDQQQPRLLGPGASK